MFITRKPEATITAEYYQEFKNIHLKLQRLHRTLRNPKRTDSFP